MVPKPEIPSTTGAGSSNTAALAAAARSAAAAVEQLAKMAIAKAQKPARPVSSDGGERAQKLSAKASGKCRPLQTSEVLVYNGFVEIVHQ